jgi:serine/threonine protein kinase
MEAVKHATKTANLKLFTEGDYICQEGQSDHSLHMIFQGKVAVPLDSRRMTKKTLHVAELGTGSILGEHSFLTKRPQTRDVYAMTNVVTLSWSRKDLHQFVYEYPSFVHWLSELADYRIEQNQTQRFGNYEIAEYLGSGSTAQVYRAYHPILERSVAIKKLDYECTLNPDFKTRFIREAQVIASLNHPNIVQLYDLEFRDENYWMVLELVEGKDLNNRLKAGKQFSVEEIQSIVYQASLAIRYAHEKGLIHGDIKPANCMLDNHNTLKLMDFGLVQKVQQCHTNTHSNVVYGTPEYIAPELIRGAQAHIGSDIYSLGVMAYHLATGKSPFRESSVDAVLQSQLTKKVIPVGKLRPDLPAGLETFINEALIKDPERRIKSWSKILRLVGADSSTSVKKGMKSLFHSLLFRSVLANSHTTHS